MVHMFSRALTNWFHFSSRLATSLTCLACLDFIANHLTCSEGAPRIHREGALELRPRARPLPGGLPSGAAGGRALRPSAIGLKSVASQSFLFVCRRNHIQYPIWRSHKGFAYWLFASFPMLDNVNYQLDQNSIPVVSESELWPRATINYHDAAYRTRQA